MNTLIGKKIAVLLTDGFEQVEMVKPMDALKKEGAEVFLVSNKATVQGWNHAEKGNTFETDVLLENANPYAFDALILPGGVMNPDTLRTLPEAVNFITDMYKQQKLIAAICHAPWLLINAKIASGKQLTSWPSVKTDLINAGANWLDDPVVKDGNVITSRKPQDIPQFNKAVIEYLQA